MPSLGGLRFCMPLSDLQAAAVFSCRCTAINICCFKVMEALQLLARRHHEQARMTSTRARA